jgi:hypothetical protein
LKEKFNVKEDFHETVYSKYRNNYTRDVCADQLQFQLNQLENHPYYTQESFTVKLKKLSLMTSL